MSTTHTPAILLKSVAFNDADRMLTFVTQQFGKCSAVAKGARRSRRRFSGALEPFQVVDLQLRRGRADVSTLLSATVAETFPKVTSDLVSLDIAGRALRLVKNSVAVDAEDQKVFFETRKFLVLLNRTETPAQQLYLGFASRILHLVGFAPQLAQCCFCNRTPLPDQPVTVEPNLGAVRCQSCGGGRIQLNATARSCLARWFGQSWEDSRPIEKKTLAQVRSLLSSMYEYHVGVILD